MRPKKKGGAPDSATPESNEQHKQQQHTYGALREQGDTPQAIAAALGGKWKNDRALVLCPAHADNKPSLSLTVSGGKFLWHCHAGCSQIAVREALVGLGLRLGTKVLSKSTETKPYNKNHDPRALFARAVPAKGTIVERYLVETRGIDFELPPEILCLDRVRAGFNVPAMLVVAHDRYNQICAAQITLLNSETATKLGTKADRKTYGSPKEGSVRLWADMFELTNGDTVGITEGVETALAVMKLGALGVIPWATTWPALGARNMANMLLPPSVKNVVLFADNDPAGEEAWRNAFRVYKDRGFCVEVYKPPTEGQDFNDYLREVNQ